MKLHVLFRAVDNGEECLGAVVSPSDLETLQHDGDAMPTRAYLSEVDAVETADGRFAFVRKAVLFECDHFALAVHDEAQAAKDFAVAALSPTLRADLFPDFKSEAERKAERAERRAEALAKQAAEAAEAKAAADAAEAAFEARVQAAAAKLTEAVKP
jgi:hypothetical protein